MLDVETVHRLGMNDSHSRKIRPTSKQTEEGMKFESSNVHLSLFIGQC